MKNVDVGVIVRVTLNGQPAFGKVRRLGERQRGGWHMATLDIDGAVAYVPVHERELVQYAQVARA